MNIQDRIVYQIYPFGFTGAPKAQDNVVTPRIRQVIDWIPHLTAMGVNTVYFCPIFNCDSHGYDTRSFMELDPRLGSNDDFAAVCAALKTAGIEVLLDGVFNHVGRGFWAFEDVVKNREASAYKDWFYIDFNGESNYGDNLWYEGWEGHYELVKLNLSCDAVRQHIFDAIHRWVEWFGITGIRLDVAYLLPEWFMEQLHDYCARYGDGFHLIGETIHGDYGRLARPGRLNSTTNYECYKGIYSSLNERNMFEIGHSLKRQFGPEDWAVYRGLPLLSFVDNHDVNRIASTLTDPQLLPLAYGFIYAMPGFPSVYYGSEWGAEGIKGEFDDDALRQHFDAPQQNELTAWLRKLADIRQSTPALRYGDYREVFCTNPALCFQRSTDGNSVLVLINAGEDAFTPPGEWHGESLVTGDAIDGSVTCAPMSVEIIQLH